MCGTKGGARLSSLLFATSTFGLSQMVSYPYAYIPTLLIFKKSHVITLLCLKLPLKLIFVVFDSESNLEFYLTKWIFSQNRILSVYQVFTKTLNSLVSKNNISCPNEQFSYFSICSSSKILFRDATFWVIFKVLGGTIDTF